MDRDDLGELLREYEADNNPPGTVYLPSEDYYDVIDSESHYSRCSYLGYEIVIDGTIDSPQVLPEVDRLRGDDLILSDPPIALLRDIVEPEVEEYQDPVRSTENMVIRARVFLEPFCVWQRFDPEMVARYGHPEDSPTLTVLGGDDGEFTRTEFEGSRRVKFGKEIVTSGELAPSVENVEREICHWIKETLTGISRCPVRVERTRRFRGPYPVLDTVHCEEHLFGEIYTTYSGIAMVPNSQIKSGLVSRLK